MSRDLLKRSNLQLIWTHFSMTKNLQRKDAVLYGNVWTNPFFGGKSFQWLKMLGKLSGNLRKIFKNTKDAELSEKFFPHIEKFSENFPNFPTFSQKCQHIFGIVLLRSRYFRMFGSWKICFIYPHFYVLCRATRVKKMNKLTLSQALHLYLELLSEEIVSITKWFRAIGVGWFSEIYF